MILSVATGGSLSKPGLEYYGDRQIRPELKLSVPRSVQATILRRFKTALASAAIQQQLSKQQGQLDSGVRQLQLIESVVSRYGSRRSSSSPSISRSPDASPDRFWVYSTAFASSWIPRRKTASWRVSTPAGSTLISLRVLLLLVLVPLLVQQIAGTYLISLRSISFELPF